MTLFDPLEREFASAIGDLSHANPFVPARIEAERRALGDAFHAEDEVWSPRLGEHSERPNVERLASVTERLVESLRDRRRDGLRPTPAEIPLYEDLVGYHLFYRFQEPLRQSILDEARRPSPLDAEASPSRGRRASATAPTSISGRERATPLARFDVFDEFRSEFERLMDFPEHRREGGPDAARLFAALYQVRRAFHHIYTGFIGSSKPAIALRAAVWQSIFTHDMRRYRRCLYSRMGDVTTLVTGPSGSGKEIVARAIGLSRFVPFDPNSRQFEICVSDSYFPLNLSALSPTIIESELFGHCRGSFTGAVADHAGWLEQCPERGTVFLDEIGELDESIQVKLLRAIQEGEVTPLGAGETRRVDVRWIAATNRDLAAGVEAGEFREDLYFRLDVLRVRVPPLRDRAGDVTLLVDRLLEKKFARTERPAPTVQPQARRALESYPWPGNVRELENLTERLAALHRGDKIELGDLPEGIRELGTPEGFPAFAAAREAFERRYLLDLLQESSGHMTRAASIAGLSRQALYAKIGAYGIDPERFRDGSRRTPLEGGD